MDKSIILPVEVNPDDQALTLRAFKKSDIRNEVVVKPMDFIRFTETVRQLGSNWLDCNQAPPNGKRRR